jgi:hypothetical protein
MLRARRGVDSINHRKGSANSPKVSEILIPSRSQGEFLNEPVRDWLARREGDASLGSLEPGCGDVAGMRLDGGRRQIEAALLTERCITRDDRFSDPEPWHFIGDNFFGVRQRARKLSAQSNQQGSEVFRSLSYVGVVISKHGQSRLMLA